MFNFSPKNDKFYDFFIEFTEVIQEAAKELSNLSRNMESVESISSKLNAIEHKGDALSRKIIAELNNSFITPLDREDILIIARKLDDVVDNIEDIAGRCLMYDLKTSRDKSYKMVDLIEQCADNLKELFIRLKDFKKDNSVNESIANINRLESQGDYAYRDAMRELFTTNVDNVELVIWKDLYEKLEKALDSCELVANLVEGVVMKYA